MAPKGRRYGRIRVALAAIAEAQANVLPAKRTLKRFPEPLPHAVSFSLWEKVGMRGTVQALPAWESWLILQPSSPAACCKRWQWSRG